MKASELRIGNCVNVLGANQQVIDIMCDGASTIFNECIPYDDIEPIPLTKEWLLKLGFKKMEWNRPTSYYLDFGFCDIFYNYEGIVEMHVADVEIYLHHIKHVHQLQNLYFALTGEELAI
jgi:hypothetical protein